ncbi:hypothetical protein NFI96_012791, partial [Prochilodus magdalenae]
LHVVFISLCPAFLQVGVFLALVLPLLVGSTTVSQELFPTDCSDVYANGQTLSGVYTIYPAGDTPVQVYCDMGCEGQTEDGKWTVIQRRMDGSLNFYRPWEPYKKGFGNKYGEYWLGLENLYQLTRKRKYELKVDMQDFEGVTVYAQYSTFSVESEADGYKLHVGGFLNGGAGEGASSQSLNQGDSMNTHDGQKFSTFDKDQDTQASNCAKRSIYVEHSCNKSLPSYANPNGMYFFVGKWINSTMAPGVFATLLFLLPVAVHVQLLLPLDCGDIRNYDSRQPSGVYTIYPIGSTSAVRVYCDMDTDGGGWTVFQRRIDGSVNFYRGWDQYRAGFGFADGEYWLGLESLFHMTLRKKYELRVDMEDWEGGSVFAQYSSFSVDPERFGYTLHVSGFRNGGAGDSMNTHNGQKFSTFDKDQDPPETNCARVYRGAFWYNACHHANPNGMYLWGSDKLYYATGVEWFHW